jgi:hypothetical protein
MGLKNPRRADGIRAGQCTGDGGGDPAGQPQDLQALKSILEETTGPG